VPEHRELFDSLNIIRGKRYSLTFIPVLSVNGVTVTPQDEVADMFLESASSSANCAPAFLQLKAREDSLRLSLATGATEPYNSFLTMSSLESALLRTRDTSPGPDTIHNQMFKHLPHSTLVILLNIYNHIWSEGSFYQSG
jgi:hypothetical protein